MDFEWLMNRVCLDSRRAGALQRCKSMMIVGLAGNSKYDLNLEYSGLAKELFTRPGYYFFLTIYLTYTVTANIAMGRIVAQAADDFIVLVSGHDYALQFYPTFGWVKAESSSYFYNNPSHLVLAITVGYLIAAVILAPMAFFQLMAALGVQAVLLIIVFLACIEFTAFFVKQGLTAEVPLFGSNWTQVMGPIIFNLGVGGSTFYNRALSHLFSILIPSRKKSMTFANPLLLILNASSQSQK